MESLQSPAVALFWSFAGVKSHLPGSFYLLRHFLSFLSNSTSPFFLWSHKVHDFCETSFPKSPRRCLSPPGSVPVRWRAVAHDARSSPATWWLVPIFPRHSDKATALSVLWLPHFQKREISSSLESRYVFVTEGNTLRWCLREPHGSKEGLLNQALWSPSLHSI